MRRFSTRWSRGRNQAVKVTGWLVTLISLGLLGGRVARAEPGDDLIRKGIEQRRAGHDAEALKLFRRAYELEDSGRTLAQMGLAEQALGIWTDAEIHIRDALKRDKEPWIRKNRDAIRKALDVVGAHLGSLDVWGSPAGAEVLIGGVRVASLPLEAPLRVSSGTVSLSVRAPNHLEVARAVEVPAGGSVRERFELPRKPVAPIVVTRAPEPQPSAGRPASLVNLRAQPAQSEAAEPSAPFYKRWWFWTAVAVVAAGATTTAILLSRPSPACVEGAGTKCGTVQN